MSRRRTQKDHEKVFRVVTKFKGYDGGEYTTFHGPYATKAAAKGIATVEGSRSLSVKVQESVLDWKDVED